MKPVYMSMKELRQAYENVPSKKDISIAVSSLHYFQASGRPRYDFWETGENLIKFYRRSAEKNWAKHGAKNTRIDLRKQPNFFAERAKAWEAKAAAVEKAMARLKEAMEDEDHQALV